MIICNGIPKSGTHALEKSVQLLGLQTMLTHSPHSEKLDGKHILIARHPRNVMVSWLRFTKRLVTEGYLLGAMEQAIADYTAYEGYLTDPDVLVVRFESLPSDGGKTLQEIADYAGVDVPPDAYRNIEGLTTTWTGNYSNWREHWNERLEAAWKAIGGYEVEKTWNY